MHKTSGLRDPYQVTADVARRLADGVDPVVNTTAEGVAGSVSGVIHAHALIHAVPRLTAATVHTDHLTAPGLHDPHAPLAHHASDG